MATKATPVSSQPATLGDPASQQRLRPARRALRRFLRHRVAVVGVLILLFVALFVTAGALFYTEANANYNDTSRRLLPPSAAHPFGTDTIGRDILARIIYGGQISLLIGLTAVSVSVALGTAVGVLSGYFGGALDSLLMRFTEAMLTIPSLFLLIVTAKFFGGRLPDVILFGRELTGSVLVIILIIGATSWMYLARIVRANVLSLREMDYVAAARALGVSNARIIITHLLPNTFAPIIVSATLGVAGAILSEAYVSFFGLGVQVPTASWGNMLESAYKYLESAPWLWFFPGMFILLTVLSINFVGDGLRDAFDPRTR